MGFQNTKKLLAHFLFLLIFGGSILTLSAPNAYAGAWGESIAAAIMQTTIQNIQQQIQGALLGTLKVAAIQLLNNQVLQSIDGSTGGQSSIITNFDQFLNTVPEEEAKNVIINDFLSQSLRGKESIANYISANQSSGIANNYNAELKQAVLDATVNRKEIPRNTLSECSSGGDPRLSIAEGNFKDLNCLFASPANNPIGIALSAQGVYTKTLEEKKKEQEVVAQSSGVKPILDANGNIIIPAGSVENLINDVTTLGSKIITGAQNPAEFLSGVVVSVVNRTVTGLIRKGTGEIQRTISREIGNINVQTSKAINDAQGVLGPAGQVIDSRINQTIQTTGGKPTVPTPKTGP